MRVEGKWEGEGSYKLFYIAKYMNPSPKTTALAKSLDFFVGYFQKSEYTLYC